MVQNVETNEQMRFFHTLNDFKKIFASKALWKNQMMKNQPEQNNKSNKSNFGNGHCFPFINVLYRNSTPILNFKNILCTFQIRKILHYINKSNFGLWCKIFRGTSNVLFHYKNFIWFFTIGTFQPPTEIIMVFQRQCAYFNSKIQNYDKKSSIKKNDEKCIK